MLLLGEHSPGSVAGGVLGEGKLNGGRALTNSCCGRERLVGRLGAAWSSMAASESDSEYFCMGSIGKTNGGFGSDSIAAFECEGQMDDPSACLHPSQPIELKSTEVPSPSRHLRRGVRQGELKRIRSSLSAVCYENRSLGMILECSRYNISSLVSPTMMLRR